MSPEGQEIVQLGDLTNQTVMREGQQNWSLNLNSSMKVAVGCQSHKADLCMT